MDATTEAVQIVGRYGFCKDGPVGKWCGDAKIMALCEGTGPIQRTIIARALTGLECK